MNIYTKKGDTGSTSLCNGVRISKADDRIELVGTIDELSSFLGLAKVVADEQLKDALSHIQRNLILIMAGVADPKNMEYRFHKEETDFLEKEIDRLEQSFSRAKEFVLYGGCEVSARLDVARAVARRAERRFQKVSRNYGADANAMQYMNRLADYLYIWARYLDAEIKQQENATIEETVVKNIIEQIYAKKRT